MKNSTIKQTIYSLSVIFILAIIWLILSTVMNNEIVYPTIGSVFKAFGQLFVGKSIVILLSSFIRLIITIIITFAISFIILFLYIWKKDSLAFFNPIINVMRSVPFVSLSILLIIVFGNRIAPYIICILVIFPITIQGLVGAINEIDQALLDDLSLMNVSIFKSLRYVYIPIILPTILTTFLQIFGLGFKVIVMGEYFSQTNNSIGKALYYAKSALEMDTIIAWTIMIIIIVTIVELILLYMKKRQTKTTL